MGNKEMGIESVYTEQFPSNWIDDEPFKELFL